VQGTYPPWNEHWICNTTRPSRLHHAIPHNDPFLPLKTALNTFSLAGVGGVNINFTDPFSPLSSPNIAGRDGDIWIVVTESEGGISTPPPMLALELALEPVLELLLPRPPPKNQRLILELVGDPGLLDVKDDEGPGELGGLELGLIIEFIEFGLAVAYPLELESEPCP
jgi:hypothetical protein